MKLVRILLLFLLLPGCAAMEDFFIPPYEGETYIEAAPAGCQAVAPNGQPVQAAPISPVPMIQPAGYQTKEPPTM